MGLMFYFLSDVQDGIGNIKITPNGIQLNGTAMVLDTLFASSISSRRGRSLALNSGQNITLIARDELGRVSNKIFLGKVFSLLK